MALRLVYWVALAIGTASYAADVTFGTATARPGQRADGFLTVPTGADAATNLPVILIHGARPRALPDLRRAWYGVRVDCGDAQAGAVGGPRHAFRNHGDPPSAQSGVVRADGAAPESSGRQELEPTVSR